MKYLIIILLIIILTQDLHVFPLFLYSLIYKKKHRDKDTLPDDVESTFIKTKDNKHIELWHVPAKKEKKGSVLIFHGNGELVDTNVDQQRWFAEQGWDSYSFDYRGYGRSTGIPSEKGIYIDSDAIWQHLKEQRNLSTENLIVVGYSLGSAPASRIASIIKPKTLLIIAGYSSIKAVARDRVLFRPLLPFVWNKLATRDYISELDSTNLILTHGKPDKIIKFHHMSLNADKYRGSGRLKKIEHERANHLEIFWATKEEILKELESA